MLRLNLSATPYWIELHPGVEVEVRPYTSTLLSEIWQDPACEGVAEGRELSAIDHAKVVARHAIISWRGVGDESGREIDPSPAAIEALLDLWPIYTAFQARYITPGGLVSAEGNGSAASPNGTTAVAETIAKPVPASAKPARAARPRRKA